MSKEVNSGSDQNSESSGNGSNVIECAICMEACVFPTELPCSHIFCYLCLKGTAITAFQNGDSIRCSMCRATIPKELISQPQLKLANSVFQETVNSSLYQWYYESRSGGWWQFEERLRNEIEEAFLEGKTTIKLLIVSQLYELDLKKMIQFRVNRPDTIRRIKRDIPTIDKKGISGIRLFHTASVSDQLPNSSTNPSIPSVASTSTSGGGDGQTSEKLRTEQYFAVATPLFIPGRDVPVPFAVGNPDEGEVNEDEYSFDNHAALIFSDEEIELGGSQNSDSAEEEMNDTVLISATSSSESANTSIAELFDSNTWDQNDEFLSEEEYIEQQSTFNDTEDEHSDENEDFNNDYLENSNDDASTNESINPEETFEMEQEHSDSITDEETSEEYEENEILDATFEEEDEEDSEWSYYEYSSDDSDYNNQMN